MAISHDQGVGPQRARKTQDRKARDQLLINLIPFQAGLLLGIPIMKNTQ